MESTSSKALFQTPLSGQPMLFPASTCHNHHCDRGTIRNMPHSRCSCESISGVSGFSRLLPAVPPVGNLSEPWLRLPDPSSRSKYEFLLNTYPVYREFNDSYPPLDYALLANARRKNATRETTTKLKTWLNEHKKNPYPTKGEKVMLAILTKMTLTQVSTWFANARRRLKKENKMTWSPKKKCGEKKNNSKNNDDCSSISEDMDLDVDDESLSKGFSAMSSLNKKEKQTTAPRNNERPSVIIRTLESPTFNEIKDRFESQPSPVNDLQNWVNGCFQGNHLNNDLNDFPNELTPPSTPIESKVTTFTSQKLFEAFDASRYSKFKEKPPSPGTSDISPVIIFSSKQPVLSTRETVSTSSISSKVGISSVMTPQPSPKHEEKEFFNSRPKEEKQTNESTSKIITMTSEPEVRVQGLTSSRELEAVLALTNLYKS